MLLNKLKFTDYLILATIILAICKLSGKFKIPWIVVFLPVIVPAALATSAFAGFLVLALFGSVLAAIVSGAVIFSGSTLAIALPLIKSYVRRD